MANTIGEKELKTKWPIEEGLIAGTTSQQGRVSNLVPQIKSFVPQRKRAGLDGTR